MTTSSDTPSPHKVTQTAVPPRSAPTATTDLPYRPCVGVMLFNASGQVLVAHRRDAPPGTWQMPQGGIDPGEDPLPAAHRELREEIGTNAATLLEAHEDWLSYDLPAHLIGKLWKGRYRGQRQKWFAMRFTGDYGDITVDTEHPEFDAWKWAEIEDLPDLVISFKRTVYQALVERFAPLASALAREVAAP